MNIANNVKNTLDTIPTANGDAKKIVALVKKNGKVTGYKLSDNSIVEKNEAIAIAKNGGISGVGIAHRGNNEYLKSIPDGSESNNLSNLPSLSARSFK
jgi:hypothetical protein